MDLSICIPFVFLLVVCLETLVDSRSTLINKLSEFDGKISNNVLEEGTKVASRIECAEKCLLHSTCVTFFFIADKKQCHLHKTVEKFNVTGLTSMASSEYYFLIISDYTYDPTYNIRYRLGQTDGLSWMEHKQICMSEGGDLITIKNEGMRLWIANIISSFPGGPIIDVWHVDGNDIEQEGTWMDKNSEPAYVKWGSGNPGNAHHHPAGQDCIALDRGKAYLMNDLSCYWNYFAQTSYICEISF